MNFAFRNDQFVVYGSKMSSDARQNNKQGNSKMLKGKQDKLDFSELLKNETIRLATL